MAERRDATEPQDEDLLSADEIAKRWIDRSKPPEEEEPESGLKPWQQRKLEYDRSRVRLRLDVPGWLRSEVEHEANDQDMSISQFSSFLLAYALWRFRETDPAMLELLESSKTRIASLRWQFAVDLAEVAEMLTKSETEGRK